MKLSSPFIAVLFISLCACADGGSGDDGAVGGTSTDPTTPPAPTVTTDNHAYEFDTERQGYRHYVGFLLGEPLNSNAGMTWGPLENLPTTGSANYDGIIRVLVPSPGPSNHVLGEMRMNVDFAGNQVVGIADNFHHETVGQQVEGTLNFQPATLTQSGDRSSGTMVVTGTIGRLTDDVGFVDGTAESVNMTGTADYEFRGPSGGAIRGEVDLRATATGEAGSADSDGDFWLIRQR